MCSRYVGARQRTATACGLYANTRAYGSPEGEPRCFMSEDLPAHTDYSWSDKGYDVHACFHSNENPKSLLNGDQG